MAVLRTFAVRALLVVSMLVSVGCGGASLLPDGGMPGMGARRLFLSSSTHTGDLGGVAGADATCQTLTSAAGISGNFVAYVSSSGNEANSRVVAQGPWHLITADAQPGELVFSSKSAFTRGGPTTDVNVDEHGAVVANTDVWTGATETCTSWASSVSATTGTVGSPTTASGDGWRDIGAIPCASQRRLLCVEN